MSARWLRPRRAIAMLAISILLTTTAIARPHRVLVLPLDGNADAPTRTKLTSSVQKLARMLDGEVSSGTTTFAETAAAVGCDATDAKCIDEVLATLSVDEIVWGTATSDHGQITLVVRRGSKGNAPREVTTTLRPQDPQDRISSSLLPVFQERTAVPDGSGSAGSAASEPGSDAVASGSAHGNEPAIPIGPERDPHERNIGIALAAGGGIALILGIALWSSEASLQDQINSHDTRSASDIAEVRALEDSASHYAWGGNVMVVVGLAVGGWGAYRLYNDHKARVAARVAPVRPDQGTGAVITIGGSW